MHNGSMPVRPPDASPVATAAPSHEPGATPPVELRVDYKRLNAFFADYVKNISRGATFIPSNPPLPVGTEFVFHLVVPALAEPITLRGRVESVRGPEAPFPDGTPPAERVPGALVRFLYDSPEQRAAVERSAERLMSDSLGQLLTGELLSASPPENAVHG